MDNVTKLFSVVMMIVASSTLEVHAQSYVTYNHDEAKMNQITVQEIGAGGLTLHSTTMFSIVVTRGQQVQRTSLPIVHWQVSQGGNRWTMLILSKHPWRSVRRLKHSMLLTARSIWHGLPKERR